jgi:DNA-binding transcriptional MerR regulator
MSIRPVDIARKLGISTTTLRKYEEFGLVPPVPRSAAGYRMYTHEHLAYFACARDMLPAFSTSEILKIFRPVMVKEIDMALWMANKAQSDLYGEKMIAGKIVKNLLLKNESKYQASGKKWTIHDISRETGVPETAIRYWDKVGLITAGRHKENNYRIFEAEHVKQVLAICALKFSARVFRQRHSIKHIREELSAFDYSDKERISMMVQGIEQYFSQVNRAQIRSISSLFHLCDQVVSGHFDEPILR